jgi:DNA primase
MMIVNFKFQIGCSLNSTKITRNFIDNLVESINIMEFMESVYDSDFIISKNSDWANTRCPMPDHNDNNPSFGVNVASNTYNCFGCGASGDLIKLVQEVEGFNFIEAIQKLSIYANIDIETVDFDAKYIMREVNNTIKKYLEKENNSSNYPGGVSEVNFLIAFSEKIKKYERLTNLNPKFIDWTDSVYKQIDDELHKNNHQALNSLWKTFIKDAKIKMGELNEQH